LTQFALPLKIKPSRQDTASTHAALFTRKSNFEQAHFRDPGVC